MTFQGRFRIITISVPQIVESTSDRTRNPLIDVLSKRTDFSPKCGDGYLAGNRQDGFGNFEGGTSMVTDKTAKVEHITGHSFFEISFLQ